MKKVTVAIRGDECIGSGNCSAIAPDIFDHDHNGTAVVRPGREIVDETAELLEAVEICPVSAVVVSEVRDA